MRIWAALAAIFIGSSLGAASSSAQVVERNLPPAPEPRPQALAPAQPPLVQADETPLGAKLRAVVMLSADEPTQGPHVIADRSGVDVSPALRLSHARAVHALRPLFGRPLSRRLIAEAQAAVARAYRSAGYPFLSVSPPEQEITSGVLQLRVVEFKIGSKTVAGAQSSEEARAVGDRVRLPPGGAINAPAVSDDLAWLGRDPFRKVQLVFSPGLSLGETNVQLQVSDNAPYSIYAGYSNSGSPSTGIDRYFAGGEVAGLLGFGSLASYQVTASSDALFNDDRLFSSADRPRYMSQAARVSIQPASRVELDVVADYVASNAPEQDFIVNQRTYELEFDVRTALSNLAPSLGGWGDVRLGIAGKRQETRTFFDDAKVSETALEDYQVEMGYSRDEVDALGRSDLDVLVHLSVGGVDDANAADRVSAVTKGRLTDARYAYISAVLNRTTGLPFGWSWQLQMIGQYAAQPLPSTEQVGIGGQNLVRGYTLDDGAYDRAVVMRNEMHVSPLSLHAPLVNVVAPYVFFDAGWGSNLAIPGRNQTVSSAGGGLSTLVLGHFSVDLDVACALTNASSTHSGDWRLDSRVTLAF